MRYMLWIRILIIIEQNSAAKRATLKSYIMERNVLIIYFCEIIHEGAEWLEVYSRSVVKEKYACMGAMLLEENGKGRSNYFSSYVFLFYLISNKHAILNTPPDRKKKKKSHHHHHHISLPVRLVNVDSINFSKKNYILKNLSKAQISN